MNTLLWLLIQLAAIVIGAGRVRLSSNYPAAGEHLAIDLMLAVQVMAGACLFPMLLSNWRLAAVAIVTAWPFVELTGFLSGTSFTQSVLAGAYISAWLAALAVWRSALPGRRWQLYGVAVAAGLALGGPLMWYLHAEFTMHAAGIDWGHWSAAGPIMGALAVVHGKDAGLGAWGFIAAVLATSTGLAIWRRRRGDARNVKRET